MTVIALPPSPFRFALLRRAVALWLLLRIAFVVVGLLIDLAPLPELVFLTAGAAGFMALLTAWFTLFDARRRRETLFLANLGVAHRDLAVLALAPAVALELVVRLAGTL